MEYRNFIRIELKNDTHEVQEKKYEESTGSVIFAIVFDVVRHG